MGERRSRCSSQEPHPISWLCDLEVRPFRLCIVSILPTSHQLFVRRHRRSMFGGQVFSVAGPTVWGTGQSAWSDSFRHYPKTSFPSVLVYASHYELCDHALYKFAIDNDIDIDEGDWRRCCVTLNAGRDTWKKKYFDEKRKTVPLEEQYKRLKCELEVNNRKIVAQLEKTHDGQPSSTGQPPQQASFRYRWQGRRPPQKMENTLHPSANLPQILPLYPLFYGNLSILWYKSIRFSSLDGCIVWYAHNTVFDSKCWAICAQAVYFLHSTRPSVTWLNSRWWLAACDCMSDVNVIRRVVNPRRKSEKIW